MNACATAPSIACSKSDRATPTIVYGSSFRSSVAPTARAGLPNDATASAWDTTATGCCCRSSAAVSHRPAAGVTPSTSNRRPVV
jgi:hypothetical protein